jgi:hypothetical protein
VRPLSSLRHFRCALVDWRFKVRLTNRSSPSALLSLLRTSGHFRYSFSRTLTNISGSFGCRRLDSSKTVRSLGMSSLCRRLLSSLSKHFLKRFFLILKTASFLMFWLCIYVSLKSVKLSVVRRLNVHLKYKKLHVFYLPVFLILLVHVLVCFARLLLIDCSFFIANRP